MTWATSRANNLITGLGLRAPDTRAGAAVGGQILQRAPACVHVTRPRIARASPGGGPGGRTPGRTESSHPRRPRTLLALGFAVKSPLEVQRRACSAQVGIARVIRLSAPGLSASRPASATGRRDRLHHPGRPPPGRCDSAPVGGPSALATGYQLARRASAPPPAVADIRGTWSRGRPGTRDGLASLGTPSRYSGARPVYGTRRWGEDRRVRSLPATASPSRQLGP